MSGVPVLVVASMLHLLLVPVAGPLSQELPVIR